MTAQPMLRDEYERPRVEVRQSTLSSPIAGEGLFTQRDFKTGDIVAFYNGVKGAHYVDHDYAYVDFRSQILRSQTVQ